mgnify:CR=1 FL=1
MTTKAWTWNGEANRETMVCRPCPCGCDNRNPEFDGWAGYMTGSDADGNGFTMWIKEEEKFVAVQKLFSKDGE